MRLSDNFFNRVEEKTNVDKDTIMNLANKIQNDNMKDEKTIKEIIQSLAKITGKTVTKEHEEKIINAIKNDNIPNNIDSYYQ